ncbi:1,4-alpha-glucan branching protein domain-containing protein [Halalkalibacterium ligniniphilum]|uniref:1,4-alpha-glucan branching protein domain-containing protein n=1 Tax=Halalkalibacterium ligniniphilum TaxID=1134413 RepID=UPI0003470CDC|nr:1,4-alpha-glucan branching protein domain-containing protein [Halalkalibacterium ligniniphilum]
MKEGYYSLVLHTHLPYVRHEEEGRLEERWLFEAITESYIPLLWVLETTPVAEAITISFSPPVMEMLSDPLIQKRYLHYLETTEQLIEKEKKSASDKKTEALVQFYDERYKKIKQTFLSWDKQLLFAFRTQMEQKRCALITSAATHAFLPYLKTTGALRAQIKHGIDCFERHFGKRPLGFWLPECSFSPGVDRILFEEGIRYTFVDEHALIGADPKPKKGAGAPVYSPHGVILFPRHSELSGKVWSSTLGYPGDVDYREFYRDIAYERDWEYIQPFVHEKGIRIDTGLKYHRITGKTDEKAEYVREWAEGKIHSHASDFIHGIRAQIEQHGGQSYPPYHMVTPFDTELFGHWWFEGPEWIGALFEQGQDQIAFVTPENYIRRHYQDFETVHVSFSTWGREGYGDVWLNETNAWLYRHYHRMEQELATLSALYTNPTSLEKRAMQQMVREWMLAVSSDWAFILDGQSAVQYANERIHTHLARFDEIKKRLLTKKLTESWLTTTEKAFPFLKQIDETIFMSPHDRYVQKKEHHSSKAKKRSILMLSWEYPPMMVGGLSRHVFDLSRMLVLEGHEVHVVTTSVDGYPDYEVNQGVYVHRVKGLQPKADAFFDWVGSLNAAMFDYVKKFTRKHHFDFIHAHDWLVSVAAKALKKRLEIPLLATIHATEHGRNNGIHSPLQYEINQKEWELTYEANRVIVCSDYMKQEIQSIFSLPEEKLVVIPNGVDPTLLQSELDKEEYHLERFTVFSVGRIVKEKGFQTVIDTADKVREKHLPIQFVIAGKGPLLESYQQQVRERQLEEYVTFLGFINDEQRNWWLHACDATVFPSLYEPFGIVALESMAVGKATIVSDTGGLGDIVNHGENGLKIYPGDVRSLLEQVISLYKDPELKRRVAENGRNDVETNFNWRTIAKRTEEEMERCLKKEMIKI